MKLKVISMKSNLSRNIAGKSHPICYELFLKDKPKLLSGENLTDAIEYVMKYNPLAIGFNCMTFGALEQAVKRIKPGMNWGFYLNCGGGELTDTKIECALFLLQNMQTKLRSI